MSRIPVLNTFALIPAGRHIFRIYGVDYNESFGILMIYLINAQGMTHRERFGLKGANDEANAGAMNAFSFFAHTAMNDFSIEDIDPEELVGRYIGCEIVHTELPSNKPGQEGKMLTFANIGDKWPADGFDTQPVPTALTKVLEDKDRPKYGEDRRIQRRERRQTAPAPAQPAPAAQAAPVAAPSVDLDALLG